MAKTVLSVIILTLNEEANLAACLQSILPLKADIFIVDSGSTDRTLEIARCAGAHVVQHDWENHARQLNWGIDNLPIRTEWVMRLDADERVTSELARELQLELPRLPVEVTGLFVKRRVYFWGRWIRHGGYYPTWLLRLWRSGCAHCEQRWMDEHIILDKGSALHLGHDIIDENRKGLTFWTNKHNSYADHEVRDLLDQKAKAAFFNDQPDDQAGRRRWAKENIYGRTPLFVRAFLYWFYRYFVLLGVMDGKPGFVFHFLQGFWYRFLIDAKLFELQRDKRSYPD